MKRQVCQGDVIKLAGIPVPVLVVSKDFFNATGEVIGCPILKNGTDGPLHIYIETEKTKGYVQCEKLKLLDLNVRGFSVRDRIAMADIINITDAIQGIFDYI